ncbi:MAG: glyceraldehyde-3-phosphate dehydrogenase [Magnetococcales bacterium]|nr:glyceraldehyde-3-phosphate dehydrogenase [Magnetococcales bacterium]MBF0150338.1 glyceraldehyde-3-phosphate dehydrogenase [Magnetococcales bacterium]MBF0173582.1 glyceraldehyde-3-phosphate dehydrogenase [Magnetococcales bacterium]MBF0629455.1 glyceraldehyde-3-phosphate dehydrogenase [Magnetococcales bacterium]
MKIGINGMGRIGKLSVWNQVAKKHFSEIVVNVGREVGRGLQDLLQTIEKDSTFGHIGVWLHGYGGGRVIENMNEAEGTATIDGVPVRFLRTHRNPREVQWRQHGVSLVVDCTGVFMDPTTAANQSGGALRGHLEAGATKVILSAPFKIKNKGQPMPPDALTVVLGINDADLDPGRHSVISGASCTTTCLAFMMKPLLDHFGAGRILSASMVTVHAATPSQKVLDAVPKAGATDLRKTRSVMNNIILTTTGAANTLRLVLPEMAHIGFMAESVRIPTSTGSLIVLNVNLQSENKEKPIDREQILEVYRQAAQGVHSAYLEYSDEQNVSSDIIGYPRKAAVIEAQETHTRTGFVSIDPRRIEGLGQDALGAIGSRSLEIPVTQATIFGWYDNELGSYAHLLGDLTIRIARQMV